VFPCIYFLTQARLSSFCHLYKHIGRSRNTLTRRLLCGTQGVKDTTRMWQQALNIISLKETGMRKGGMHIQIGRRVGKQMSSFYKFFICIGWLEWFDCAHSCDLTTNPVCKLLFISGKVCQTWALIFYPDFPLVACSRTCSPRNLWLPLVLMTDY